MSYLQSLINRREAYRLYASVGIVPPLPRPVNDVDVVEFYENPRRWLGLETGAPPDNHLPPDPAPLVGTTREAVKADPVERPEKRREWRPWTQAEWDMKFEKRGNTWFAPAWYFKQQEGEAHAPQRQQSNR